MFSTYTPVIVHKYGQTPHNVKKRQATDLFSGHLEHMLQDYIFHETFADECGLSPADQQGICDLFHSYANRWLEYGLTHFTYCSAFVNTDGPDLINCYLMRGHPDWIEYYFQNDLSQMLSSLCQSQPPYSIAFYAKQKRFISPKYAGLMVQGLKYGMTYDFLYQLRNNPMAGAGFSGGRKNEILSKQVLYAAMGSAVEMHEKINIKLGAAAERKLGLTENEVKYLHLLFYGMSQQQIAQTSGVSRNWVAKACMSLRRKLVVSSNSAAVARALGLHILR